MEELDLRGEVCPFTFLHTKLRLEELPLGATLTVVFDNEAAAQNVPRSLASEGHEIVSVEHASGVWRITTVKRREHPLVGGHVRNS